MGKDGRRIPRADTGRLGVIVQNTAKYSKVHDEGGRVGNGAVLPAWGFMFISAKARADLAEIALDWILRGKSSEPRNSHRRRQKRRWFG